LDPPSLTNHSPRWVEGANNSTTDKMFRHWSPFQFTTTSVSTTTELKLWESYLPNRFEKTWISVINFRGLAATFWLLKLTFRFQLKTTLTVYWHLTISAFPLDKSPSSIKCSWTRFLSCRGDMTALAGGISRMMRPTPPQNYPRGGYSLEGKVLASLPWLRCIHKVDFIKQIWSDTLPIFWLAKEKGHRRP